MNKIKRLSQILSHYLLGKKKMFKKKGGRRKSVPGESDESALGSLSGEKKLANASWRWFVR